MKQEKQNIHQEATAFVTKASITCDSDVSEVDKIHIDAIANDQDNSSIQLNSHQLLMQAIESNEDFGDNRFLHETNSFFQQGFITSKWVDKPRTNRLLGSKLSCNLMVNPQLVRNICRAPNGQVMHINCNSGVAHTNLIADLPGFGGVWFYEQGIANVLSLALISNWFRVTMDGDCDDALHIHKLEGGTCCFRR